MSESADSIGKVLSDMRAFAGAMTKSALTLGEIGLRGQCVEGRDIICALADRISALERQSAERIADLNSMQANLLLENEGRERAESALAEVRKLLRAILPALACQDTYNPCSDLRRRIDAFLTQHQKGADDGR